MAEYKDVTSLKKEIADFKKSANSPNSDYMTGYISALSAVEGKIAGLPDADVVEVKHGEWILHNDGSGTCKVCGRHQKAIWDMCSWQKYCGHCGAKMDERMV